MTAVGPIRLNRGYVTGDESGYPADDVLGIDGYLTTGATRLAVLAGVRQSFDKAQQLLLEMCGWRLDDNTIRKATHDVAAQATATRSDRADAPRFAEAKGVAEVPIDAGKINTTEGWRDVKVAVFAMREEGKPATPDQYAERKLPAPTVRTVVAAIEPVAEFATRVRAETDRLNLTTAADVTVLGDGAEWIWNMAEDVLPLAGGVLDIYHAAERIADATKAIWGDGTAEAKRHLEGGRSTLLSKGKAGLEAWIGAVFVEIPEGVSSDALLSLAAYFASHPTHLHYAERLAAGRSIGSGLVEGTVKQLINLRLKRTGARWIAEHVGPFVELIALADSPDWMPYWTTA